MEKHPIVHVEFSAKDRKVSQEFYAKAFGWELTPYDDMNYTTFNTGEGVAGGLNPVSEDYPAGTVTVYIQTSDITGSLAAVEAAGGTIVSSEWEVPGVGKFGFFRDPSGNMVGLITWTEPSAS